MPTPNRLIPKPFVRGLTLRDDIFALYTHYHHWHNNGCACECCALMREHADDLKYALSLPDDKTVR